MKRCLTTLLLALSVVVGVAAEVAPPDDERITHHFRDTLFTDALRAIEQSQTTYTIAIRSDSLAYLRTSAKVQGLTVPEAVALVCKGLPVKVKTKGTHIMVQYDKHARQRILELKGTVNDARAHNQLLGATVKLLREDSTFVDSLTATSYWSSDVGYNWQTSEFTFKVPALPARYIFEVSLDGYKTTSIDYTLDRIGRRELSRELPPFYLQHDAMVMHEVTVKASRVRFYYRGDTIVYNADVFQLAEGSMLDALIRQIPGVELHSDGRIYHNGKFVDDLLLNGKDFFRGDRKMMLQNLPAYTVKDIAIYDKQTEENEWLGRRDTMSQRHVIDVRLKKEYMVGWIANVEAGTGLRGDEMPYMARLFAMRHTDHSSISFAANANNLDNDSYPDAKDQQWKGGNGLRRREQASVYGTTESRDKEWDFWGSAKVNHTTERSEQTIARQTFLPSGDIYEHIFNDNRSEDWKLKIMQRLAFKGKHLMMSAYPDVAYERFHNSASSTSAAFTAPVAEVSRQVLDDLYSPTTTRPNLRDTLINRQLRERRGDGHDLAASLFVRNILKFNKSNDNLRFYFGGDYTERAQQQLSRQQVLYAATSSQPTLTPPLFRHQLSDIPPRRRLELYGTLGYTLPLGQGWRQLMAEYTYRHVNQRERESLYRLDQLPSADSAFARPIDQLPSYSEYQRTIDRSNSHMSHYTDNQHELSVNLGYNFKQRDYGQAAILINGAATLTQQCMDYERGALSTVLHRTAPSFDLVAHPFINFASNGSISFNLSLRASQPDLINQAAIRDDIDPMNIRLGNPDLRSSIHTGYQLSFGKLLKKLRLTNSTALSYDRDYRSIAIGQTYDRATGIRTNRPENINGNWYTGVRHTLNCNLDSAQRYNLSVVTGLNYRNSVDLMGDSVPMPSTVRTLSFNFGPKLKLSLKKHTLNITSQLTVDRYASHRADFTNMTAITYRIGADAILHLPWKFDLTTDLTLYGRRGYLDASMNTNDVVWNARLSRPLLKGRVVVMLDGFDLLGQLDQITRTINAQGRTETYTNVMPRYALLHVVYRFDKKPKGMP